MKVLRYCVLFPEAKNVHLIKDVGMIAYKLCNLYDISSRIACYNNDSYEYANTILKGLELDFIESKFNNDILDGALYLRKKGRNIDVLQLFHVTLRSVVYALVYKHCNKKGRIFLKLDCTEELIEKIRNLSGAGRKAFNFFFNKVDLIGVEQKKLLGEIRELLPDFQTKIQYIPNGIDYNLLNVENINPNEKENIILQVGRIGSEEKNSEMLVEAFIKMKDVGSSNWRLKFVGEVTESFKAYLAHVFEKKPELAARIECTGPVYDRNKLMEIYKEAKIFCLTSHFESFGIALMEAAACGDVIISTDVGIAREFTINGGEIVEDGDVEGLSKVLYEYTHSREISEISRKNMALVKDNYDWNVIVERLYKKLVCDEE